MMMNDSEEEEEQTALVCDNGKFLIPSTILRKTGFSKNKNTGQGP